ncbi:MAG TPA: hypothetical protein VGW35_15110 [Methylomirabilota bacterium]|nr:hypothetical protein [Methylomirabilota bacterium]
MSISQRAVGDRLPARTVEWLLLAVLAAYLVGFAQRVDVSGTPALVHQAGLLVLLVLWTFRLAIRDRVLRMIVIGAFLVRALSLPALALLTADWRRDEFYFIDDRAYVVVALQAIYSWSHGLAYDLVTGIGSFATGYYYLNVVLLTLLGQSVPLLQLVNCAVGAVTVAVLHALTRDVFGLRPARLCAVVAAFASNLWFWSLFNLKDNWIVLALVVLALIVQRLLSGRASALSVLLALAALTWLATTRDHVAYLALAFAALAFLAGRLGGLLSRARLSLKTAVYGLALLVAVGFVPREIGYGYWGSGFFAGAAERLLSFQEGSDVGEDSYFSGTRVQGLRSLLVHVPAGAVHFALAPVPWKASGIYQGMIPGSLVLYLLYPLALVGLLELAARRPSFTVFLGGLLAVLWMLYSMAAWGGGVRHRAIFEPFVIMLAAQGWFVRPLGPIALALGLVALPAPFLHLALGPGGVAAVYGAVAGALLLWLGGRHRWVPSGTIVRGT